MKKSEFATYIRLRTKTNSSTFTDAQIIALANARKDDIAEEVTKANEDFFLREFVRNLEAGKRRYSFPSDIMTHMKVLNLKLDGTNWNTDVAEVDMTRVKTSLKTEDAIQGAFSMVSPAIEIYSSGFMILSGAPIEDVEDGISLWATQYPADLTSIAGTDELSANPDEQSFGMPRVFHKLWADGVVIDYKSSKEKPIPLTEREQNWEGYLHRKVESLSPQNLSREVNSEYPRDTGEDY